MRGRRSRRGTILLQATLLLIVVMGLAALVIDVAIARTTQSFLQTSADVASLEGLRGRDGVPGNPPLSDLARRAVASRAARLVFDDDFDDATELEDYLLGAGPQFDTGVGGIDDPAGGLLVSDGPYVPLLELNALGNAGYGDLVAGEFEALDPLAPGNPDWHAEDETYTRSDFLPSAIADSPTQKAFLARLRRTNDRQGLDNQPGVSSAGPALPFLFGLGSGVLSTDDPAVYDPRRDGITVRATAIADARPAVAVGIAQGGVAGVVAVGVSAVNPSTPRVLAFEDSAWQLELVTNAPIQLEVGNDGVLRGTGATPPILGFATPAAEMLRVGLVTSAVASPGSLLFTATPAQLVGVGYVALYRTSGAGGSVLTGFAALRIDSAVPGIDGGGNPTLILSGAKLPSLVAPQNASAVPSLAAEIGALLPPSPAREPLLAPVLAR